MYDKSEKRVIFLLCKCLEYTGMGVFPLSHSLSARDGLHPPPSAAMILYSLFVLAVGHAMVALEFAALAKLDLPETTWKMSLALALSHTMYLAKLWTLISNGRLICEILNDMCVKLPSLFNDKDIAKKAARQARLNTAFVTTPIAIGVCLMIAENNAKSPSLCGPLIWYSPIGDDSLLTTVVSWAFGALGSGLIIANALILDSFVVLFLIYINGQFQQAQKMFEMVNGHEGDSESPQSDFGDYFKNRFAAAVEMHEMSFKCASNIQRALWLNFAINLAHCLNLLVVTLIMCIEKHDIMSILNDGIYLAYTLVYLAQYTCYAGNVTEQASNVAASIYGTPWYTAGPSVRPHLVLALARAQRPLVFRAGYLFPLTHAAFVTIVRASYSSFALFV